MSVDRAFRKMIRQEIGVQLRPIQSAMSGLQLGASHLRVLRQIVETLAPIFGFSANGTGNGIRVASRRGRPRLNGARICALAGCRNPARSRGYCAAHYQKLRNLIRTNRRPADWKDFASPNSVRDIVLPRGRAAAKLKLPGRRRKSI